MENVISERILITGANGFVGSYLVRAIRQQEPSWDLVLAGGPDANGFEYRVDLSDAAGVDAMVEQAQPTAIVHLAAVSAVGSAVRDPRKAWHVNVGGTLNMILSAERHAASSHFLYVSSAEVYGASFGSGVSMNEDQAVQPLNAYAASKAAAELLVAQAARNGMRATIVRPFNHTGPGQDTAFVIPAFADQIARIERGLSPPVLKVGNLDDERDFSDVRDIVDGYIRVLQCSKGIESGAIFNLASGQARRIGDILDLLLMCSTTKITVEVDPQRYRPARIGKVTGDAGKAATILGWVPKIPMDVTLKLVLEDCRARLALKEA